MARRTVPLRIATARLQIAVAPASTYASRAAALRHILIEEAAGPDRDEVQRAWNEAKHHLEVARRLGEDVPSREDILDAPEVMGRAAGGVSAAPAP